MPVIGLSLGVNSRFDLQNELQIANKLQNATIIALKVENGSGTGIALL